MLKNNPATASDPARRVAAWRKHVSELNKEVLAALKLCESGVPRDDFINYCHDIEKMYDKITEAESVAIIKTLNKAKEFAEQQNKKGGH